MTRVLKNMNTIALVATMLIALLASTAFAGVRFGARYASAAKADVRVWIAAGHDNGAYYDVYPSFDGVVINVRASRACYAAVYVVDTEGFVHVLHPVSPWDDQFFVGGRTYRFNISNAPFCEYGGRGVAYAFAVTSPVPFTFAEYGVGVFGRNFGFQVWGDPFVASRYFYLSLAPACRPNLIAVGYARFYVAEYVQYPRYLCVGWHNMDGVRRVCRGTCEAYRWYNAHSKDPYRVLGPSHPLQGSGRVTRIAEAEWVRHKPTPVPNSKSRTVVRSSKRSFLESRQIASDMRRKLATRDESKAQAVDAARRVAVKGKSKVKRSSGVDKAELSKRKVKHGAR